MNYLLSHNSEQNPKRSEPLPVYVCMCFMYFQKCMTFPCCCLLMCVYVCVNECMNVFLQVWAWKENVWEKERGTLLERYTVEQSRPASQGGAVLSTLTINNVMESDFQSTYNCTAWNAFGPGTMIITLEETGQKKTLWQMQYNVSL